MADSHEEQQRGREQRMKYDVEVFVLFLFLLIGTTGCFEASSPDAGDASTDADADTDTDSYSDSDTVPAATITDCAGGKLDTTTNLCWQDPPLEESTMWYFAISYCDDLELGGHSDWRLPDINELISLLNGCVDGRKTVDSSHSACEMTPTGCAATYSCDDMENCVECSTLEGPGAEGCFWDPELSGRCSSYWSSTSLSTDSTSAWAANFRHGNVSSRMRGTELLIRCVRTATDSDTDTDIDTDTDTDTNTDTGTGLESSMTDCDGGKLDPEVDLCWQDPPLKDSMYWYNAISYCDELDRGGHQDWRLPDIDELISLMCGCANGEVVGDLTPSECEMTPAGCAATDTCDGLSNCNYCSTLDGPGAGGCFWDPSLNGNCFWYWSSTSSAADPPGAWYVDFHQGYVYSYPKSINNLVRCVRDGL